MKEKLRVGMIGVAGRGGVWRNWHQPDGGRCVVTAGADMREDFLKKFSDENGKDPFVTMDYRLLLERDDVDAVAICSPDFTHEEYACAAMEAGKDVFCEKPMAITIEGCDHMLETSKRTGRKIFVGHNMRYMNIIRTMKQIVDDGVIGAVKAVWVRHFVGAGGGWYFHDWHATKKNATSLFLQKGCHDIDVLHWIAGAYTTRTSAFGGLDYFGGDKPDDLTCPECNIRETCTEAQSAHYLGDQHVQCCFRKEVDVEDNQVMIMNLEGGIRAAYLQCHFAPDTERNYVFIGTEGRMESHWPEMQVRVKTRKSGTWKQYADRTYDIKKAEGGHGGADPVICRDFVDYILDDKEPVAQVYASRMSVAAGVCAADSLRQGGMPVDIPAAPEGFGKGERS